MSTLLTTKHFDHLQREGAIYTAWEAAKCFKPEACKDQSAPVFNMSLPPPNANGELHLGHSSGYSVMDTLARYHRLKGSRVLLVPGKDHAGIQTQVVYEKRLKQQGVDPTSLDRDTIYQQCYDFCIDRSKYMQSQEKRLGLSADWERELFTLDPRLSSIVFETFERMWNEGLVYRGARIINWSVFCQTSISDVEVEYKEQDGKLWHILYPFAEPTDSSDKGLTVATTRPETMLGDVAVAVHPEDERYQAIIGKRLSLPLTNRSIPIIADSRVDKEFGTGVVKITPAHDFLDFDIGQDHNLPPRMVIGKDGHMTEEAGPQFAGLSSTECRSNVIESLSKDGLLVKEESIKHKVPIGERGKDIIEPLISEQWFVNVDKPGASLKAKALELVRSGDLHVYPERFSSLLEQWLVNLRDWNISRQLWWGHRIPVWYKGNETIVSQTTPSGPGWIQETDTFDTWFSSGQWAFSTTSALNLLNLESPSSAFFPTHTMVMGRDILLFWACRMLLLTAYRTSTLPWRNVYFTGLIRDEHGQKMSKSKNNGIEPNVWMDEFGADALRLTLLIGCGPGNDMNLAKRKIEGYSKFTNKLWNAAKLLNMKLGNAPITAPKELKLESSKWMTNLVAQKTKLIAAKLEECDLGVAIDELYGLAWSEYCDWYLEMMKVLIDQGSPETKEEVRFVAYSTFRDLLIGLHPFIPFITEEIYQGLAPMKRADFLMVEAWPKKGADKVDSDGIDEVKEIVTAIRSVKAALNIPHKRIKVSLAAKLSEERSLLVRELSKVDFCASSEIASELALKKPSSSGLIICEVEGKENYTKRLKKDLEANQTVIVTLQKKLSGDFAARANRDLVEKEQERLQIAQRLVLELEKELTLAE